MKMVFIVCETGVDYKVTKILDELHILGYIRQSGLTGVGDMARGGTAGHGVPGQNTVFIGLMPDEMRSEVTERLQHLVASYEDRHPPVCRAFASPAEVLF